ncbi:MAG: DUF1475 family protein [Ignavibacteriales bacterium]|nr:DUF1475 family protein [Ignavibacteriales bacterium]
MKNFLIAVFSILFIYIVYTVISTSIESNLFKEWDFLASIPWMKATLIDFYINTVVIFVWMAFREKSWLARILWLLGFVLLGSIATTFYVLVQLFKLDKNEPVINAFLLKKA